MKNNLLTNEKPTTFDELVYKTKNLLDNLSENLIEFNTEVYNNLYTSINQMISFFYDREESGNDNADYLDSKLLITIMNICYNLPKTSIPTVETTLSLIGFVYREKHKLVQISRSGTARVTLPRIEQDVAARFISQLVPMKKIGNDIKSSHLYYYDFAKGIYDDDFRVFNSLLIHLDGKMTIKGRNEVIAFIDQSSEIPFSKPTSLQNLVVLGNGIYDVTTQQLSPFSPEYVFITKSDVNWNPNAQHPKFEDGWNFEDFLNLQAKGEDDVKMFWQTIQFTLLTNKPKKVFVFLYDALGNTGKGTFSKLLSNLIGSANVGTANINALSDRFGLEHVYNKSLIYGDENDNVYVTVNNNMKSMATGDAVSVEGKGLKSFSVSVTPMILQSMNSTPVFRNMDGGTKRRLRMIEFTHSYTGEVNENVKSEYICNQELLEWIAYTALTMPVEEFVDSNNSKSIKGEMESESNPVHAFLEEILPELKSTKFPTNLLFTYFLIWLKRQNKKTDWSNKRFIKELNIEVRKFGWNYDNSKRKFYTSFSKIDYDKIYEEYLEVGGFSNFLPTLYDYSHPMTETMLKRPNRLIYK